MKENACVLMCMCACVYMLNLNVIITKIIIEYFQDQTNIGYNRHDSKCKKKTEKINNIQ